MSGSPSLGSYLSGLVGGTPYVISILNVRIKTASVGGYMEEFIMVYSPYLWALVKCHAAARLGHHGMEGAVGKIIHPRGRSIVLVKADLFFRVVKAVHISLYYRVFSATEGRLGNILPPFFNVWFLSENQE